MKSLNGNTFEAGLCVTFEFTYGEADQFLSAKCEDRSRALDEILSHKSPLPENSSYNATSFFGSVGKALAEKRERDLKQLPENTPAPKASESEGA